MFDKYPALKWVLLALVILLLVPLLAMLIMMAMGMGMMSGMMGHIGSPMMAFGVLWLALIVAALLFLIVVLARGTKHV